MNDRTVKQVIVGTSGRGKINREGDRSKYGQSILYPCMKIEL
jgi:hypothetical protein